MTLSKKEKAFDWIVDAVNDGGYIDRYVLHPLQDTWRDILTSTIVQTAENLLRKNFTLRFIHVQIVTHHSIMG